MNKKEAEILKLQLQHEKDVMFDLKQTYRKALEDIKAKVRILQQDVELLKELDLENKSILQSKIYQLNYQQALEKQVGKIVNVLQKEEIENVQMFLNKMYEDNYLGMQYVINSQGIPITTPINPSLMVETINQPVAKMTFADRIGQNMIDFKNIVKSEISRGIANGSTYNQIAQMLSMVTGEALYKSQRIIRTEGARISSKARLTSLRDAKEKGADLAEEWSATLDHKTRPLHAKLDGQIREVGEYFEAYGTKVLAPGMFDNAGDNCNCRCALLGVPKWDIEEVKTRIDNITGEYVQVKNYQDWKEKYYNDNMFKYMDYVDKKYEKYKTKDFEKMLDNLSEREYKHFGELYLKAYK